jgi:hypothetical protein
MAPKLITLSASTVRDQRTLIWLQSQNTAVNWSKWDAVVCGLESYKSWSKCNTKIVGVIITELQNDDNAFRDLAECARTCSLVLVSQKVLSLKPQEFWSETFDNVVDLDNIMDQYPFIEQAWDGSLDGAVAIFGLLCRYNRVVDCNPTAAVTSLYKHMSFVSGIQPNQVWVFTQFFKHKNPKRYQEIKDCLKRNCECPYVDKVVLINEMDYSSEYNPIFDTTTAAAKIQQVVSGNRLTYADFLKYVHDKTPANVFAVLSNADIYFGDSLLDLSKINMADKMMGLLRWDVENIHNDADAKIFGPRADSHDSWIFLSDSVKSRVWNYNLFDFHLGQPGCDNAFAGYILRQKFLLINPSLTFKTFHLHNTNIRDYNKKDSIHADLYINLVPTYIIDSKQVIRPDNKPFKITNDLVEFEVKSSSMSNEITYCTMLEKEGRYNWEPSVENYYFEAGIPVYNWSKSCVTPNGLVYDQYNIYIGGKGGVVDEKFNYWTSVTTTPLTPLQSSERMFAIPFKNTDVFSNPDTYIVNYLSRCLRLLKHQAEPTAFWIPRNYMEYLEYFEWPKDKLVPVYFDENTACYAKEVVGFLPGYKSCELGSEDIQALREVYPAWVEKPTGKVCSVILGRTITQAFAEEKIAKFLHSTIGECDEGWTVRFVSESDHASYDSLMGASLCIFVGGEKESKSWTKLWSLPKGCCVVEFQQELHVAGEFQHLAHVAGFKSWVLLLSKGSVKDVQEQIMEQLQKWYKKNEGDLVF